MLSLAEPLRHISSPQMRKFCVLLKEKDIPEEVWREEMYRQTQKGSRADLTLIETIPLIDWAERYNMNTAEIINWNAEWEKPPKPENGFSEDGDYFGTITKAETMTSKDGLTEWVKFKFRVDEGPYAGETSEVSVFYLIKGQKNDNGLDRLKKIAEQTDEKLRQRGLEFFPVLNALCTLVEGRKAKVNQATKDGRVWLNLVEIFETSF